MKNNSRVVLTLMWLDLSCFIAYSVLYWSMPIVCLPHKYYVILILMRLGDGLNEILWLVRYQRIVFETRNTVVRT